MDRFTAWLDLQSPFERWKDQMKHEGHPNRKLLERFTPKVTKIIEHIVISTSRRMVNLPSLSVVKWIREYLGELGKNLETTW